MEIKEIKEKVKKLKDELKSKELKKEGSSSMGIALKMGTEFVAAVFVASFIGFHVDKWLQTTPIFIIIFFYYRISCRHFKCCALF